MIKSTRMAFNLFNSVASLPPPPLVNPNLRTSSFSFILNHNIIPTITKKHHKIIFFPSTLRSLFTSAATPSQGNTEGQETGQGDTPAPSLSTLTTYRLLAGSSSSSARTQIDLLDQLTASSSSNDGPFSSHAILTTSRISLLVPIDCFPDSSYVDSLDYDSFQKLTIRQKLANLVGGRDDDFTIPLGKNLKKVSASFLTISQKRNIKRQTYLNEVSQRNDSVFFATIGAFILLPPIVILGIAIATGYVQLFP
ncbi:unnamed protein product [Rhodiola kirilowii]